MKPLRKILDNPGAITDLALYFYPDSSMMFVECAKLEKSRGLVRFNGKDDRTTLIIEPGGIQLAVEKDGKTEVLPVPFPLIDEIRKLGYSSEIKEEPAPAPKLKPLSELEKSPRACQAVYMAEFPGEFHSHTDTEKVDGSTRTTMWGTGDELLEVYETGLFFRRTRTDLVLPVEHTEKITRTLQNHGFNV